MDAPRAAPAAVPAPRSFRLMSNSLKTCLGVVACLTCAPGFATEPVAKSTKVVRVNPRDKATDVDPRAPVQVHFSNGLKLLTLDADSVRLLTSVGATVQARLGSDIEGDVVNLRPVKPLSPRSSYTIEVTSKLIDKDGGAVTAFRSSFTTGVDRPPAEPREGFRFAKAKVDDERGPTAIAVGPDGNIYVSTYDG